jgi:uncharacterized cupin superfamily protein
MTTHTAMPIDEMEGIYGGSFKRARGSLGVAAFGMSVSDLPAGFDGVPAHTHTFDGQEEIYLALRGGGELEVDGERVALDRETVVRVAPAAIRRPIAGPEGLRLLSVGAAPGRAYEPFPNSEIGSDEVPIPELPGIRAAAEQAGEQPPAEPRFTTKRFDEMDSARGAFHFVRASLGVEAFGISMIRFPANYEDYPRHSEDASGQEEVYIPLSGGGHIEIEGEEVTLEPGMMVRVGPDALRKVLPGDEGIELLVVGGVPGRAYEPPDFSKLRREDS